MRLAELPARDEHEQVMLEVVVHPVRRHEGTRQEAGEHRAGVPQRVVVLGGQGVLGDVADAADDLIPGGERHEPQEQVEPAVAERGERREEDGIGDERAAPARPHGRAAAIRRSPGQRAPTRGDADEIAQHVTPEYAPAHRVRRGEREVGIVGLARMPMMQVMPAAIGPNVDADRVGAEPARDPVVDARAGRQSPVRSLVHQDREPELPGADQRNGQDQRGGGRPGDVEPHRADDQGPRVQHESRAAQAGYPAQVAKLGQGQDVPGDERCG
jgi:hypothetical protein